MTHPVSPTPSALTIAFTEPLNPLGGIDFARPVERLIAQTVVDAGAEGLTHAVSASRAWSNRQQVRAKIGNPYGRLVEFYVDRTTKLWVPDYLATFGMREVIENAGKERRLRIYDIEAYRAYLASIGHTDDTPIVPPEKIGQFADMSFRQFARSPADFKTMLQLTADGKVYTHVPKGQPIDSADGPKKKQGRPRKVQPDDDAASEAATPTGFSDPGFEYQVSEFRPRAPPTNRPSRYAEGSIQVRGRPRKYLYVLTPEGKVSRNVIGSVKSRDDLAPVWIYLKDEDVLVPAPTHFTGLGPVPPVTEEMMAEAKEPDWFLQFESADNGKLPKTKRKARKDSEEAETEGEQARPKRKSKAKGKGKAADPIEVEDEQEIAGAMDVDGADIVALPPPKSNKRKSTATTQTSSSKRKSRRTDPDIQAEPVPAAEPDASTPTVRRSGRARQSKPVYVAPAELEGPVDDAAVEIEAPGDVDMVDVFKVASDRGPTPAAPEPGLDTDTDPTPADPVDSAHTNKRALSPQPEDTETQKRSRTAAQSISHPTETASTESAPEEIQLPLLPPMGSTPSVMPPAPRFHFPRKTTTPSTSGPSQPLPTTPTPQKGFPVRWRRTLAAPVPKNQRIDLGMVRRMNELVEALKDVGGVMLDTRHWRAHTAWVDRVAGTDTLHAPRTAYGMDRTVYKAAIEKMDKEGRIKRTKAMVQSAVGRWMPQDVVFLPEMPMEQVNAYCAELAQEDMWGHMERKRNQTKVEVEAQAFTKVTVQPPQAAKVPHVRHVDGGNDRPGTARRNMLLREAHVGAMLLGWQPGQHARARTLHTEIARLVREHPDLPNIASTSPDIVLLSLLLDDMRVGVFFQCMWTQAYEEELDIWLHDGDNFNIPLKDVPSRFQATASFRSPAHKAKLKTLLSTLVDLQIITPLVPCRKADAILTAETRDPRSGSYFNAAPVIGKATHLLLHPVGPVYHIAHPSHRLLGSLPVKTAEEVNMYWMRVQHACVEPDLTVIGHCDPIHTTWPDVAQSVGQLDLPEERLKFLASWARWQSAIRLLTQQARAIEAVVSYEGNPSISTDAEIEQFAYENALPIAFAKAQIAKQAAVARERILRAQRQKEQVEQTIRIRRAAAQETLREKMHNRREEIQKEWTDKVKRIAREAEVEYTEQLVNFVNRRAAAMSKASVSDKTVYEIIRLSTKQMGAEDDNDELASQMILPMGKRKVKPPMTSIERSARANPAGFARKSSP